jgi:hypothetical protein
MGGSVTAAKLMANLNRLGIRIKADGDRLLFSPRSVVTPDLAESMKAHKSELLAMLRTGDAPVAFALAIQTSVPADGKWHTVYDITHGEYDWINEVFDDPTIATSPETDT